MADAETAFNASVQAIREQMNAVGEMTDALRATPPNQAVTNMISTFKSTNAGLQKDVQEETAEHKAIVNANLQNQGVYKASLARLNAELDFTQDSLARDMQQKEENNAAAGEAAQSKLAAQEMLETFQSNCE